MPRLPRIQFENAWYHVMNRGGARRITFENNKQSQAFLECLENVCLTTGIEIHAYCLMTNHFHLLVRTPRANLGTAMQQLLSKYTLDFNRGKKIDGALFRGRYKAVLIDADDYLVQVSRYIHRNPVEAKLCKRAKEYPWSSYPVYLCAQPLHSWIRTDEVLARVFPRNSPQAYQQFVDNPLLPSLQNFYQGRRLSSILGDKSFRRRILSTLSQQDSLLQKAPIVSLDNILQATAAHFDIAAESLFCSQRGKRNPAKNVAIFLARSRYSHSLTSVANRFLISPSTVSELNSSIQKNLKINLQLSDDIKRIEEKLLVDGR